MGMGLIGTFEWLCRSEQFRPNWFGFLVSPFYLARRGLLRALREMGSNVTGRTLDVGCGTKPYKTLFKSSEYIGLEVDTPENRRGKAADVFYSGGRFPFDDGSFDSIVTNQVFEHVFDPGTFLRETNRVLKEEGILLLTVPFIWDEHEQPFDFGRYSSFGIRSMLERHGFTILKQQKTKLGVAVIFQLWTGYVYKVIVCRNRYVNLLSTLVFLAPFNLLGAMLGGLFSRRNDLYLDNVVLARKARSL